MNQNLTKLKKLDPEYRQRKLAKPFGYEIKGSIDPKRYVDPAIIAQKYISDPKFKEAVDLMAKIEGHTKWVQEAARYAMKKTAAVDNHVKNQKIAIDRAVKAKEMEII